MSKMPLRHLNASMQKFGKMSKLCVVYDFWSGAEVEYLVFSIIYCVSVLPMDVPEKYSFNYKSCHWTYSRSKLIL